MSNIKYMDKEVFCLNCGISLGVGYRAQISREGKKYDRIFVLSDMQAWVQSDGSPVDMVNRYKAKAGANPFIYSFDLTGNGTMQFKETSPKTIALAGFSEKIFDVMKLTEMDKNALVEAIENYPIQVVRKNKKRE